jgi:LmbE family N-acetylglucosaminyl deacetylase
MSDLKLMFVLAHPDDESMGFGGTAARYAAEGVDVHLVTASRGERGYGGDPAKAPTLEELGRLREAELRKACEVLGISNLYFLDYIDGDIDKANPEEAAEKVAHLIREIRPQVVCCFGMEGAYGHPDHIATTQFATAGTVLAASAAFSDPDGLGPYQIEKLYYRVFTKSEMDTLTPLYGAIEFEVDGEKRRDLALPDWVSSAVIECDSYWRQVVEAIGCHKSQVSDEMMNLPEELHHKALGFPQSYYRAFSMVTGGRKVETDLFEGLR